jgi:hypothetical protein
MADTTPPDLVALAFTPNIVDASSGPQAVAVTVAMSDAQAGVAQGQLRFRSPSTAQYADTWFDASHRIAGDEFKGEYENTVTIPQYAEQGMWTIEYVVLRDQASNSAWLQTTDIQNMGYPVALDQQGQGDTSPPDLADLVFNPSTISAAQAAQTVTVRVRVTDKPAGVAQTQLRFRSPSGAQYADTWFDASHRIAGDEFDGEYENVVTIPQYAEHGKWTIEYVFLRDQASTSAWLQTTDLQSKGFPVALKQKGKGDVTPPSLTGLTFAPSTVNVANGPQGVTVRIHATDKPAGMAQTQLRFRSPSGAQYADTWFDASHRITGDEFDGEYENVVTIPQFAEQGVWVMEYVLVGDAATNTEWIQTSDLQSSGFPVALSVT